MIILHSLTWLGIASLYLGFAAVLGLLLRRWRQVRRPRYAEALALAYFVLLILPASVLIIGYPGSPLLARLALLAAGLAVAWLGRAQPEWLPKRLWRPAFGLRYFGGAMALAALWALGTAATMSSLSPGLVGTAACLASVASLSTASRHA